MYAYVLYACWCQRLSEEGIEYSGTGVIIGCDHHMGAGNSTLVLSKSNKYSKPLPTLQPLLKLTQFYYLTHNRPHCHQPVCFVAILPEDQHSSIFL